MAATAAAVLLPVIAAAQPRPATVFINYEGGYVSGGDDSALDQLGCISGGFDHPAFFGSRALADQVTEQVRAIFAPFGVRVVDERPPAHLPYTMVMMGGLPQSLGFPAGVGGYACVIDCGDELPRETVLVFAETVREPRELAQTVVHEVAHSWGLDHVLSSELIMSPTTSGAERSLGDGCTALDEPGDADCLEQHAMFCDAPNMQDTVAELLAVRGPSEPDLSPPQVEIVSPRAGERVVPGALVRVEAVVDDDRPGFGWRLVVPELAWSTRDGETVRELRFPPGEHTVRVEAVDQAGNETVAEVVLWVGDAAEDVAPADGGGGDEPGEPEPLAEATDDDEASAGCRIAPGSSGDGLGMVALLLALGGSTGRRAQRKQRGMPRPHACATSSRYESQRASTSSMPSITFTR